jgi:Cof subfamily protein (haloacid dehalogenase superfamily)
VENWSAAKDLIALPLSLGIVRKAGWELMGQLKYKMIAIDLDGTLLAPDGKVTDRTRAAIHACLSAGMLVCFATGRNWTESRTVIDAVEHYSHAVFAGGAMVIDTEKDVTVHRRAVEPELAREICGLIESEGHAVLALQDTSVTGFDYLISEGLPLNEKTQHWMSITHATIRRAGKLSQHPHQHTVRLGIVAPTEQVEHVHDLLQQRYDGRVFLVRLFVPQAQVQVLEIFDAAVNKWEGILHVARHHGVAPEQIIAIGDDVNDVPMLRQAGLGVAMGNARAEIQAEAKMVIGNNREDGLARFLESLVAQNAVEPIDNAEEAA